MQEDSNGKISSENYITVVDNKKLQGLEITKGEISRIIGINSGLISWLDIIPPVKWLYFFAGAFLTIPSTLLLSMVIYLLVLIFFPDYTNITKDPRKLLIVSLFSTSSLLTFILLHVRYWHKLNRDKWKDVTGVIRDIETYNSKHVKRFMRLMSFIKIGHTPDMESISEENENLWLRRKFLIQALREAKILMDDPDFNSEEFKNEWPLSNAVEVHERAKRIANSLDNALYDGMLYDRQIGIGKTLNAIIDEKIDNKLPRILLEQEPHIVKILGELIQEALDAKREIS